MKTAGHREITTVALKDRLSPAALHLVLRANRESDDLSQQSNNAQHFDNCLKPSDFDCGLTFAKRLKRAALGYLGLASLETGAVRDGYVGSALYAMGRLLHAMQDFYSHSNWINLTGPASQIWNESFSNTGAPIPGTLKSGAWATWRDGPHEVLDPTPAAARPSYAEAKAGPLPPQPHYWESSEFYSKYLTGETLRHGELNKDQYYTIGDDVFFFKYQVRGYDVAFEDAKGHSRRKWEEFASELAQVTRPERAADILGVLKTWQIKDEDGVMGLARMRLQQL